MYEKLYVGISQYRSVTLLKLPTPKLCLNWSFKCASAQFETQLTFLDTCSGRAVSGTARINKLGPQLRLFADKPISNQPISVQQYEQLLDIISL